MSLRTIRGRRRLTQHQLSALSGVKQGTISLIESTPDPNPRWHTVRALAKALRVTSDALLARRAARRARSTP